MALIPFLAAAALVATVLAGPARSAPSFDCARAESPSERLVCGDRGLADLDRRTADAYRERLQGAEGVAREALVAEQRAWLRTRDASCGLPARGAPPDAGRLALAACLADVYSARLAALTARAPRPPSVAPDAFAFGGVEGNAELRFASDWRREGTAPAACLVFTGPVGPDAAAPRFLRAAPEDAVRWTVKDGRICAEGLDWGRAYTVRLSAGLPAADGRGLPAPRTVRLDFGGDDRSVAFLGSGFVLPRAGTTGVPIETANLDRVRVRVIRVNDRDVVRQLSRRWWRGDLDMGEDVRVIERGAGFAVWDGVLAVDRPAGAPAAAKTVTSFPLADVLRDRAPGAYLLVAAPDEREIAGLEDYGYGLDVGARAPRTRWVVETDLALTTLQAAGGLDVFARSLDTAQPAAGVEVALVSEGNEELGRTRTDAAGRATFPPGLLAGRDAASPRAVLAYGPAGDFAVLDLARPGFDLADRGAGGRRTAQPFDGFLYTDRGIYRPGETVHLSALLRDGATRGVSLPTTLIVSRPNGTEFRRVPLRPDAAGGAHHGLTLTASAMRGLWRAALHVDPTADPVAVQSFEVQDFVPLRLSVRTEGAPERLADPKALSFRLRADWLYGAPAADLATEARAAVRPDPNPFPTLPGFRFGLEDDRFQGADLEVEAGATDGDGVATVSVKAAPTVETSLPLRVTADAGVFEPGGRATPAERLSLPLADRPLHLGLKPEFEDRRAPVSGPARVTVTGVDRAGSPVPVGTVAWTLVEEEWDHVWTRTDEGTWRVRVVSTDRPLGRGTLALSGAPATLELPTRTWTRYRLTVEDPASGAATDLRYATGWRGGAPRDEADVPDLVSVVPDKARYLPGETARVTIRPQVAGTALVAIATDAVTETRFVEVPAEGATIDVPVKAEWGAGTYVLVAHHRPLAGGRSREPVRRVGLAWIGIDNGPRTLALEMPVPDLVRPETTVRLPIRVAGAAPGETAVLTVAAVDEGILALTRFQSPDPVAHFYGKRQFTPKMRDDYGRLLDGQAGPAGRVRFGGDETGGAGLTEVPTRTVALFSGPVTVGPDGRAEVAFEVPDFLGRLRFMAVAYTADRVGRAEGAAAVRPPLVADAFFPRFLAPGDQSAMTVRLDNVELPAGAVRVALSATGAVRFPGEAGLTADLPERGRATRRFDLTAADAAGIGEVTLRATGAGGFELTRRWRIEVRHPHAPIALEQAGVQAPGTAFRVEPSLLDAFVPGTARLTLGYGMVAGIDAAGVLQALYRYPFGCTEQLASVAMPLLSFADPALLSEAGVAPAGSEVRRRVQAAVDTILDRQDADGYVGLWRRGDRWASNWLVVYAGDFLLRARDAGYEVSDAAVASIDAMLDRVARGTPFETRGDANPVDIQAARAYAAHLRARRGGPLAAPLAENILRNPVREAGALTLANLAAAHAASGDRTRAEPLFRQAAQRLGVVPAGTYGAYATPLRDLLAVAALATETGDLAAAGPLVAQIPRQMRPARELNTQEKAWALRAFAALARGDPPAVVVEGVQTTAAARRTGTVLLTPTAEDVARGYVVRTEAGGRDLFRSLIVRGVPREAPSALSAGLTLAKATFRPDGTAVDPVVDAIRQNERLVVVLSGAATDRLHRALALVDLLPAGWEVEEVLTPARLRDQPGLGWIEALSRLRMQEARDDRVVVAVDVNPPQDRIWYYEEEDDGTRKPDAAAFRVAYVVRAVTPGAYVLPAATVEDMYRPTTMARTAGGLVEVLPR